MKKLPKKIVIEDRKKKAQESYDEKQVVLQEATETISRTLNIKLESVEQLKSISEEWVDSLIAKSQDNLKSVLGAGSFIPAGISKQFSDEYTRVRRECEDPIATITGVVDWCESKGIGLKIDSKGRPWLNEKDVRESVEQEATISFSAEQIAYYERFQHIFESMDDLRAYERENGYQPSDLQTIMSDRFTELAYASINGATKLPYQFSPERFFSLIAWGKICRKKE